MRWSGGEFLDHPMVWLVDKGTKERRGNVGWRGVWRRKSIMKKIDKVRKSGGVKG
jgi:hypothetical protein